MISKEQFMRYYKIQQSGDYNMITEAAEAMDAANLSKEDYHRIQMNYSYYYDEYID